MEIKKMIEKLKSGGCVRWSFCTDSEKKELCKLGTLIFHYGGVTTARLKRG